MREKGGSRPCFSSSLLLCSIKVGEAHASGWGAGAGQLSPPPTISDSSFSIKHLARKENSKWKVVVGATWCLG